MGDECQCVGGPYGDIAPAPGGDAVVDVDDILFALDCFADSGLPGCTAADFAPCGGNGVDDVDDILAVLDAFSGTGGCPNPCTAPAVANPAGGQSISDRIEKLERKRR